MFSRRMTLRTSSRALLAALVVVAVAIPLPSAALAESASAAVVAQAQCGDGRLQVPSGVENEELESTVPVVFVHGITDSAGLWSKETLDGGATLAQGVDELEGTSVFAFDYSDASIDWVTDSRIGPSLAESIRCLHDASGNQVVLVAHSMGGLAIQQALQGDVAGMVAHITTIATPFEGSHILTALNDRLRPTNVTQTGRMLAQILLAYCANRTQRSYEGEARFGCGAVGVPNSPVGTALMEGSDEIAALPAWPASIPTFRVAGDMTLALSPGVGPVPARTIGAGDIAVAIDSALSDTVPDSANPLTIPCDGNINPFSGRFMLKVRCYHSNLPLDREVIDAVLAQVEPAVGGLGGGVVGGGGGNGGGGEGGIGVGIDPVGFWTGTTHSAVFRGSSLLAAGYTSRGDFWFTVDEDGQVEGYAVVVYEPTFNVDGMNAALDTIKSLGAAAVGAIPVVIPMLDGIGTSEEIASNSLVTDPLWPTAGTVTEQGDVLQASATDGSNSTEEGITVASNTTWSAHRD